MTQRYYIVEVFDVPDEVVEGFRQYSYSPLEDIEKLYHDVGGPNLTSSEAVDKMITLSSERIFEMLRSKR